MNVICYVTTTIKFGNYVLTCSAKYPQSIELQQTQVNQRNQTTPSNRIISQTIDA
ncbi:hypothetical protein Hanom_Chr09g00781831 [Helianthus anomalus]